MNVLTHDHCDMQTLVWRLCHMLTYVMILYHGCMVVWLKFLNYIFAIQKPQLWES